MNTSAFNVEIRKALSRHPAGTIVTLQVTPEGRYRLVLHALAALFTGLSAWLYYREGSWTFPIWVLLTLNSLHLFYWTLPWRVKIKVGAQGLPLDPETGAPLPRDSFTRGRCDIDFEALLRGASK